MVLVDLTEDSICTMLSKAVSADTVSSSITVPGHALYCKGKGGK